MDVALGERKTRREKIETQEQLHPLCKANKNPKSGDEGAKELGEKSGPAATV